MHLIPLSAAIALALSSVHAQQLPPDFMPCITNCLVQAVTQDLDSCSTPDVQCLCANTKIQQDAFSCLQQQCTTQEAGAVQASVAAECAPAASSTSTHSEAPSSSPSTHVHTRSSSEAYPWGKTIASFSDPTGHTVPSLGFSLSTTSAYSTSPANSTSLTSTTSTESTTPVAPSSPALSSDPSGTTPSSTPASTNTAARLGQGAIRMYAVLGAVFGGAATCIW